MKKKFKFLKIEHAYNVKTKKIYLHLVLFGKIELKKYFKRRWWMNDRWMYIIVSLLVILTTITLSFFFGSDWQAILFEFAVNGFLSVLPTVIIFYFFWGWKAKWYSLVAYVWGVLVVDLPHGARVAFYNLGMITKEPDRGPFHSILIQVIVICIIGGIISRILGDRKKYGNNIMFGAYAMFSGTAANFLYDLFSSIDAQKSIYWGMPFEWVQPSNIFIEFIFFLQWYGIWMFFLATGCHLSVFFFNRTDKWRWKKRYEN